MTTKAEKDAITASLTASQKGVTAAQVALTATKKAVAAIVVDVAPSVPPGPVTPTPPPVVPPVVTPPAPTPAGSVKHGRDLTREMCLPRVPLAMVAGTVRTSTYNGQTVTGKRFTGTLDCDGGSVNFVDCQFDTGWLLNESSGKVTMTNCLLSPTTQAPQGVTLGPGIDATRCVIEGSSDGVRFSGQAIVECWIRTKTQGSGDHNDGIQGYIASKGGSVLRCNIDARPVGGGGGPNGAVFFADNSRGEVEIRDNYLQGGDFPLRLHEAMTYRVTGNVVVKGGGGYLLTNNAVSGAFEEWAGNTTDSGTILNP